MKFLPAAYEALEGTLAPQVKIRYERVDEANMRTASNHRRAVQLMPSEGQPAVVIRNIRNVEMQESSTSRVLTFTCTDAAETAGYFGTVIDGHTVFAHRVP